MEQNSRKTPRDKYQGLSFLERQALRMAEIMAQSLAQNAAKAPKASNKKKAKNSKNTKNAKSSRKKQNAKNPAKYQNSFFSRSKPAQQNAMRGNSPSLEDSIETRKTELSRPGWADIADAMESALASASEHLVEEEGGASLLYDGGEPALYGAALETDAMSLELPADENYALPRAVDISQDVLAMRKAVVLSEVLKRPSERRNERRRRAMHRVGMRRQEGAEPVGEK